MTDEALSPLRRRMIEDMTIRKFTPKTQHDYVQGIKNFAAFLGRSPDTARFEDVRRYQLHLVASRVGVPTINQTRARCNATASADSSNEPHQDRHLVIASQSCKSIPRARRRSTGHSKTHSDIRQPSQIARQLAQFDAAPLIHRPLHRRTACWTGSIPINELTRGAQIPIAPAAPLSVP
jgi:hypothetical protein